MAPSPGPRNAVPLGRSCAPCNKVPTPVRGRRGEGSLCRERGAAKLGGGGKRSPLTSSRPCTRSRSASGRAASPHRGPARTEGVRPKDERGLTLLVSAGAPQWQPSPVPIPHHCSIVLQLLQQLLEPWRQGLRHRWPTSGAPTGLGCLTTCYEVNRADRRLTDQFGGCPTVSHPYMANSNPSAHLCTSTTTSN